jgi:hypothetical protein
MHLEQTKQARVLRQVGKDKQVIELYPPVESPIANPFHRKQDAQRDNLARVQVGLAVLRNISHGLINTTKQFCGRLFEIRRTGP